MAGVDSVDGEDRKAPEILGDLRIDDAGGIRDGGQRANRKQDGKIHFHTGGDNDDDVDDDDDDDGAMGR